METTAEGRRKLSLVLVGLGVISAVLLVAVFAADVIGIGVLRGEIDPAISAKIADLVRAWEGTAWSITVEGGGDSYTLRSGRVALLLRHTASGISVDEMRALRTPIIEQARMALGKPEVFIVGDSQPCPDSRVVAHGYGIPGKWESVASYTASAGFGNNAEDMSSTFAEALEWFEQQLVLQRDSGS